MKFEQLIQIYWSRGFLVGGRTSNFSLNFKDFSYDMPGVSCTFKIAFYKRFEFNFFINSKFSLFDVPTADYKKIYNIFFAQNISVNNEISELVRYNLIRLFLIKSFRGKCSALGKPSRGQRTRSNSSTNLKKNQIIKSFIQQVRKNNVIEKKQVTLNRKLLKKKLKIKKPKIKMIFTQTKKSAWF